MNGNMKQAFMIETALRMASWSCRCGGGIQSYWDGMPGKSCLLFVCCNRCFTEYELSVNFVSKGIPDMPEAEMIP